MPTMSGNTLNSSMMDILLIVKVYIIVMIWGKSVGRLKEGGKGNPRTYETVSQNSKRNKVKQKVI